MMVIILGTIFIGILAIASMFLFRLYKQNNENESDKEKHIATTQDSSPIEYARSGVLALKDNSFIAIVELPSINMDLMESSEKQVILEQYRQILTSVDFPFQFLQQSRVVDVSEYLKKLETIKRQSKSVFIKKQLDYYSNYIRNLVKTRSVLTKKFYLVIKFDEELEKRKRNKGASGLTDINLGKNKKQKTKQDVIESEERFERAKKQLKSRVDLVKRSFSKFDISPKQLNDSELTELLYTSYNKERSVYQNVKGVDTDDYTSIFVKGGGVKR